MASRFKLVFAVSLLLQLLDFCRGRVGVCYGRDADNLPTPDTVAHLVQRHNIKYIRIYDSNPQVLKAFANTGIELMVGVLNSELAIFQSQSYVDSWLQNSILPYYPATKITHITVGVEVTDSPDNAAALVVPAMNNVLTALKKFGLQNTIKVSTPLSLRVLSTTFPPSAGAFRDSYANFLRPLLKFLDENQSPFMINLYPYYASGDAPLDYILFESSSEVIDPNNGKHYRNMFDAQLDAVHFALAHFVRPHFALADQNLGTSQIFVMETGWPHRGSPPEKAATATLNNAQTYATINNAHTYNTNLIRHVISGSGTPAMPGKELDVYIFSLFDENKKSGPVSEQNWGIFHPDMTSVYNLDFPGQGTNSNGRTWCIASSQASKPNLQSALDWACGPGKADCSAIQPGQRCFEPDNLVSHASFAFNNYYRKNGATDDACSFGGNGIKVDKDPSYGNCIYD